MAKVAAKNDMDKQLLGHKLINNVAHANEKCHHLQCLLPVAYWLRFPMSFGAMLGNECRPV